MYTPDPNFFGEDHFTYRVEDRNAPHANDDYDGTVRWENFCLMQILLDTEPCPRQHLLDLEASIPQVSILVIGTPDPPVAVGATLDIPMARLELSDMRNAKRIVLRVEEYDNDANEMWMIVASDIVNGTLYSAPLDLDGDEVDLETAGGFGDEIVAMMYYNMSLAAVQDLETGRVRPRRVLACSLLTSTHLTRC